jgi:hypothetical protein
MSRGSTSDRRRQARVADRQLRRYLQRQRNLRAGLPAAHCHPLDVVWLDVAYHDGTGSKLRPAVVIEAGDELLVVPLGTDRQPIQATDSYALADWSEAGLPRPSRTRPPVVVDAGDVLDLVGRVTDRDWRRIVMWSKRFEDHLVRSVTPGVPATAAPRPPGTPAGTAPTAR